MPTARHSLVSNSQRVETRCPSASSSGFAGSQIVDWSDVQQGPLPVHHSGHGSSTDIIARDFIDQNLSTWQWFCLQLELNVRITVSNTRVCLMYSFLTPAIYYLIIARATISVSNTSPSRKQNQSPNRPWKCAITLQIYLWTAVLKISFDTVIRNRQNSRRCGMIKHQMSLCAKIRWAQLTPEVNVSSSIMSFLMYICRA
jgi:hypothetical protein